jgi:hypothetical protein
MTRQLSHEYFVVSPVTVIGGDGLSQTYLVCTPSFQYTRALPKLMTPTAKHERYYAS